MANTKELTPTEISSMSEVIAKYMGKIVYRFEGITWITDDDKCDVPIERWFDSHFSWDWIHEVWEKVRDETIPIFKLDEVRYILTRGTPEQCFIALFDAIKFINQLKGEI